MSECARFFTVLGRGPYLARRVDLGCIPLGLVLEIDLESGEGRLGLCQGKLSLVDMA